jgi:hypothetical protein
MTDAAGNTVNRAITVNVTDVNEVPVFTSAATATFAENGAGIVYTATVTDDAGTTLTYSLGGTHAALFNINSTTGAVTFKTAPNYEVITDSVVNHSYSISVIASDSTYSVTKDILITLKNVAEAGDAVIDLGVYGKLIAPVQVDGGKLFYYWDLNGDGELFGADMLNHNTLDAIFKYDVNGVENTTVMNADGLYGSTDTYRFGNINGVSLALPTIGGITSSPFGANGIGFNQPGTSIGSTTASNGSNVNNPTYNDLLAVWDAYNGTSISTNSAGTPPNWFASDYWTATPSTIGHATLSINSGFVGNMADTGNRYVALQVL